MSEEGGGLLQFARAEVGAAAAVTCLQCQQPVGDVYYEAVGKTVCEPCKRRIEWHLAEGAGFTGFLKALVFGVAGGAVGATLWYAVRILTKSFSAGGEGYSVGIVAIAVGWLVGRGVNLGTGGRGGRGFQFLAAFVTYASIVVQFVPDIWQASNTSGELSGAVAVIALPLVVVFAFAVPFLGLPQNIIGLLIIGFGVFQAWRMNARPTVAFSGPFRVAGVPAAADPSA